MLGIDNQDFAFSCNYENLVWNGLIRFISFFVIVDLIKGDLLSDIWLFTLKGLLIHRCSYNW